MENLQYIPIEIRPLEILTLVEYFYAVRKTKHLIYEIICLNHTKTV
jgi:hypothetical protein